MNSLTGLPDDDTFDGRDVSADGAVQDAHIADSSLHFTAASLGGSYIPVVGGVADNVVAKFHTDGTVQASGVVISDTTNDITGVGDLTIGGTFFGDGITSTGSDLTIDGDGSDIFLRGTGVFVEETTLYSNQLFVATATSNGSAVYILNTGTGDDITGPNWSVSQSGIVTSSAVNCTSTTNALTLPKLTSESRDVISTTGSLVYDSTINNVCFYDGTNWRALTSTVLFSPRSIANLSIWLDASDASTITQSGGNLTAWLDKSATAMSLSTIWATPRWGDVTQNGLNSVSLTGDSIGNNTPSIDWNDHTIFVCCKNTSTSTFIGTGSNLIGGHFVLQGLGTTNYRYIAVGYNTLDTNTAPGTVDPVILMITMDRTVGMKIYHNGILVNSNATAGGDSPALGGFVVGYHEAGVTGPTGTLDMFEVVAYNNALSVADQNAVGNHLDIKWNIGLWTDIV